MFNQDLETPVLPAVAKARDAVLSADAIWIFSPVYNLSVPGLVKTCSIGLVEPLTPLTQVVHLPSMTS